MIDFCEWLESLIGTTIRGRLIVDVTSRIEGDRSGCVIVTVEHNPPADATPIEKLTDAVMDNGEHTELVWQMLDVANFATEPQVWEWWDEFDERTSRDDGHSSVVAMWLEVGDKTIPLAEVAPSFVRLKDIDPDGHIPGPAIVVVQVDGEQHRRNVTLPNGITDSLNVMVRTA